MFEMYINKEKRLEIIAADGAGSYTTWYAGPPLSEDMIAKFNAAQNRSTDSAREVLGYSIQQLTENFVQYLQMTNIQLLDKVATFGKLGKSANDPELIMVNRIILSRLRTDEL